MPVKCRSCGHLNRDTSVTCERCSCDLQYSVLFEKLMKNRETDSGFLFPVNTGDEDPSLLHEDADALDTEETPYSKPLSEPEECDTGEMDALRTAKKANHQELQDHAHQWFLNVTAELLLFMGIFFILSVIVKLSAHNMLIPNWKIGVASLCYYGFITVYSLFFTGQSTGSRIAARIIR